MSSDYGLVNGSRSPHRDEKYQQKSHQNHADVPIPRILSRKSQYSNQTDLESNRKTAFNDYRSPEIKPTSPRSRLPPKNPGGRTSSIGGGGGGYGSNYKTMKEISGNT